MQLVFAVLLAALAVWGLWKAVQSMRVSSVIGIGFAIIALSAVVQILNIMGLLGTAYSVVLSIITTVGLVLGFALTRRRPVSV